MGIIVALITGAIAGWLAGELVKGEGLGLLANILVGIVGSAIGQLLLNPLGIESTNWIGSVLVSTFGAAVLLLIARALSK